MTQPIGDHRPEPPNTIGTTPIEAAADVRKIGRIRRSAATWMASPSTLSCVDMTTYVNNAKTAAQVISRERLCEMARTGQ